MSRTKKNKKCAPSFKERLLENVLEKSELPDVTLPMIRACGNREICIDGCRGILEYSEDRIRLNAGRIVIILTGNRLELTVYSEIETVICGQIFSVEFEGNTGA